jgi:hypothetical protein
MPDIKETITKPIGPLPAFAWVLVIVGGYFGYKFLSGRSGSSSTTATTVGTSAGAVAPSSSDYAALTSQVSTLGNQITDLGSKISTIAPVLAPILPSQPASPPVGGTVVTAPVQSVSNLVTLANDAQIRLFGAGHGFDESVIPKSTTYENLATVWVKDPATGQQGQAYTVVQDGIQWYLLVRNTVANAAGASTNAVQDLSTPAPMPNYINAGVTGTPTVSNLLTLANDSAIRLFGASRGFDESVIPNAKTYTNLATVTIKDPASGAPAVAHIVEQNGVQYYLLDRNLVSSPTAPTYSSAQVPAQSLNIPATTPA